MQTNSSALRKITRTFILQASFISITALLSIFFAYFVIEQILIKQAITEESEHFWSRYKQDSNIDLPDTKNLTGYFTADALPKELQNRVPTANGFIEDERSDFIVHISSNGDRTLYLLYYRGQVDTLATIYGLAPLTLILVILYVSMWLAYQANRRSLSPVSWLARQLNSIDFHSNMIHPINIKSNPFKTDDELSILTNAITKLIERLNSFVERERNFTRDASHEFRSPLTVIRIAAGIISSDQQLSEKARISTNKIISAATNMEDLTAAFLLLARESDNALLTDHITVNDIAKEEIELIEGTTPASDIPIKLTEADILRVVGPEKVISVLLRNLIQNAVLYTESGSIHIRITTNSFIIQDTGIGMKQDQIKMIFDPFYRGNDSSTVGHGIGLSIVKRLSDRFQWPVSVESAPGEGTRIEILFR